MPLPLLDSDASRLSSWFYWLTRATAAVHLLVLTVAAGFFAFGALLVGAANPSIPWNWGWNTIVHVSDPIPFHNYARSDLIAMARSGSSLALATQGDGLAILNANARIPVDSVSGDFLDVTSGPDEHSFYSLSLAQEISLVARQALNWNSNIWLKAPESPSWRTGHPIRPDDVLYSEIDESGLLIGVRGTGIARNVFDSTHGGVLRTRDWQQSGSLSRIDLDEMIGTVNGYWLALRSGGIRFADRTTLDEVTSRTVSTASVSQFSASSQGDWASTIDVTGAAWLFADRTGWTGPWFGKTGTAFLSVNAIKSARLLGSTLWMGSTDGLFRYDLVRHRMESILTNAAVQDIETIGDSVLAATTTGLYLAGAGSKLVQLQREIPTGLQVSPSGDTAVYWANDNQRPEGALYAIADPTTGARPVRMQVSGWSTNRAPALRGILPVGESAMFTTDVGCFIYGGKSPSYRDCSSAVMGASLQSNLALRSFDFVSQEDGAVVASADGQSAFLNPDRGDVWTVVAPSSQVARVTAVSGQIYSLDKQGLISRFGAEGRQDSFMGIAAPSLESDGSPFRGDLSGNDRQWRLAILKRPGLVEYRSDTANWRTIPMAFEPRQVVLFEDNFAVVTPSGGLQTFPGAVDRFGNGGMPFAPTVATALARGLRDTILVGGPMGQLARYDFRSATWQIPPALGADAGSIVELEDRPGTLWARTSSGGIFQSENGKWVHQEAVRRWSSSHSGSFWILKTTGVVVGSGADTNITFGEGSGIRSFAARARYVWQPDPDRAVLIAPGATGSFDRRDDHWSEVPNTLRQPTHFVPEKHGLLILDRNQIRLLKPNLQTIDVDTGSTMPKLDIAGSFNDGHVWVLEPGKAIEYRISDDTLLTPERQAVVPESVSTLAQAAAITEGIILEPPAVVGAALRYGDLTLDWSLNNASNKVIVEWSHRPELPVWCSDEQRLAVQCSRDLWIDSVNSQVITATEAGVMHRSLANLAVPSLTPIVYGSLDPLRSTSAEIAETISWRLSTGGLSTSLDQTVLGWTQSNSHWRLDCDVVIHVRVITDHVLALETGAGTWTWDSRTGRTGPVSSPTRSILSIETAAVHLSLNDDQIRITAVDGQPAIVGGRFFFDRSTDIRGYKGNLYTLIPGRAVIMRNTLVPTHVDAMWPLPAIAAGAGWSLAPGSNGIRLAKADAEYELAADARNPMWQRVPPLSLNVSVGPFNWRRSTAGEWNVAYGDTMRTIPSWWSRGRFAWDDYLSAGALDGRRVAIATPIGIVIRSVSGRFQGLLQSPDFMSSTSAHNGKEIIGTLFDSAWLLRLDSLGRPELTPGDPAMDQSASVIFDSVQRPQLGRIFAFREEWNQATNGFPALASRVPSVPTASLLDRGRFIFDGPSAAAMLADGRWFAVTGCGSPLGCLGATFVPDKGALMLGAITDLPAKIVRFSAARNGQIFGATEEGHIFAVGAAGITETSPVQTAEAFDGGDAVQLDTKTLSWSRTPVKTWDVRQRLTMTDPDFPLFYQAGGGASFSFDVLRSLAMETDDTQLSIATEGGIFTCSGHTRDSPLIELAHICQFSYHSSQDEGNNDKRIRWIYDGKRWILVRPFVGASNEGTGLSVGPINVRGIPIQFLPGAVRIGDSSFRMSNDAWWFGRRQFQRIVDFSYDEQNATLWLCDQVQGLFAVRVDKLTQGAK